MSPSGLPPAKAWEVATPLQELWLVEPEARLNRSLSGEEIRALRKLIDSGGRIDPRDPDWTEAINDLQTLADVAATMKAQLLSAIRTQLAQGELRVFGRLRGDLLEVDASIFAEMPSMAADPMRQRDELAMIEHGGFKDGPDRYTQLRALGAAAAASLAAALKKGGRRQAAKDLKGLARRAAKADPNFPGKSLTAAAKRLRELSKTSEGVLDKSKPTPHLQTYRRAIIAAGLWKSKTGSVD